MRRGGMETVSWSGWTEVKGNAETFSAPTAAVYNGKLYVMVQGVGSRIFYNVFDGGWSGWTQVGGNQQAISGPAAAVYNGKLYVMVRGIAGWIFYNAFD